MWQDETARSMGSATSSSEPSLFEQLSKILNQNNGGSAGKKKRAKGKKGKRGKALADGETGGGSETSSSGLATAARKSKRISVDDSDEDMVIQDVD